MSLIVRLKVDYRLEGAHFNTLSKHFRDLQRQAAEQGDLVAAEKHACVSHQYRERAHACMTFSDAMGSALAAKSTHVRPYYPFEFNLLIGENEGRGHDRLVSSGDLCFRGRLRHADVRPGIPVVQAR